MRNNKRMSEPVISELAAQQDNEVVEIYRKMLAIAEEYHAYSDQMQAIAKWIHSVFKKR
jgi:hypothetical protein